MRASRAEIYGHSDHVNASAGAGDPSDLTSSRLQSELYREWRLIGVLLTKLVSAAYQSLRLCSFLSNPNLYTIQAQILINIYLILSERAADAWSQTGSLVRQCIALGLHVDPAILDPKISMREAEIRRRIW